MDTNSTTMRTRKELHARSQQTPNPERERVFNEMRKQMDYEKKYKDALERAREMIDSKKTFIGKECLEHIFPELRESEDERIRKNLIRMVNNVRNDSTEKGYYDIPFDEYISWLEKQKEQKDFRKLYEDIAKSEWFKKAYEGKSLGELASSASWKDDEQKPLTDFEAAIYSYLSDDTSGKFSKEVMHKCAVERAKVLLELARKEQKPCGCVNVESDYDKGWRDRHKAGLKGVEMQKPVTWKPSEEQMKALQNAVALTACDKELARLYNQLKKLMEDEK